MLWVLMVGVNDAVAVHCAVGDQDGDGNDDDDDDDDY